MNMQRQSGFVLIEILAGMISAGILGITMGVLLYYNYSGWKDLQGVADMQRDGSLVMNTMTRVIRGSALTNIPFVNASSGLTNSSEGWWFTKTSDRRVVYKASNGSSMNLATNVIGFTCTSLTTNVVVWLSLTNSSMNTSMSLTNTIHPRN